MSVTLLTMFFFLICTYIFGRIANGAGTNARKISLITNRCETSARVVTPVWTRPPARLTCTNRADCIPATDRVEIRYNSHRARRNSLTTNTLCPAWNACLCLSEIVYAYEVWSGNAIFAEFLFDLCLASRSFLYSALENTILFLYFWDISYARAAKWHASFFFIATSKLVIREKNGNTREEII